MNDSWWLIPLVLGVTAVSFVLGLWHGCGL